MKERLRIHRAKHSDEKTPELQRFAERLDQQAPGQPLRESEKEFLSAGTGHEFENVRIHADADADQLSRAVHATAFTVGQDIFFRNGAYDSLSPEGARLLAHEAAHTLQPRDPVAGDSHRQSISLSEPGEHSEIEADAMASTIVAGGRVNGSNAPSVSVGENSIQREDEDKKPPAAPAPGEAAAPTASNPMVRAMFETSVVGQIEAARASLAEKKPNVRMASSHLIGAKGVLETMSDVAKTEGKEALAGDSHVGAALLWGFGEDLNAHVGIKRPIAEIEVDLDPNNPDAFGKTLKRIRDDL